MIIVGQLVEALRSRPEFRRFDSRRNWNFWLHNLSGRTRSWGRVSL